MGLTPIGAGDPYGAPFRSTNHELPSPASKRRGDGGPTRREVPDATRGESGGDPPVATQDTESLGPRARQLTP